MREPHFPSSDELERQLKAAKQLRGQFLLGMAVATKRRFATQSRKLRTIEMSLAAALLGLGAFWFTLLGSPKVTEADQSTLPGNYLTRLH
jgi:hypothetical protein